MSQTKIKASLIEDGSITTEKIADASIHISKMAIDNSMSVGMALKANSQGRLEWGQAGETYTAGTGITMNGTEFSIGQPVGTSDTVQFGEVRSTGDVIAYYSSDERLKDNIKPIENALDKIDSLGGYEFDWNDNQSTYSGHDIGVIAQEVKDVFPELVIERDNGYLAVKYEKLVAVLIQGIKELKSEIEILKSK